MFVYLGFSFVSVVPGVRCHSSRSVYRCIRMTARKGGGRREEKEGDEMWRRRGQRSNESQPFKGRTTDTTPSGLVNKEEGVVKIGGSKVQVSQVELGKGIRETKKGGVGGVSRGLFVGFILEDTRRERETRCVWGGGGGGPRRRRKERKSFQ